MVDSSLVAEIVREQRIFSHPVAPIALAARAAPRRPQRTPITLAALAAPRRPQRTTITLASSSHHIVCGCVSLLVWALVTRTSSDGLISLGSFLVPLRHFFRDAGPHNKMLCGAYGTQLCEVTDKLFLFGMRRTSV